MTSVPVRKKAIMNSSSDIVKEIRKLEINPGVTMGSMTRKNVPILPTPKSCEASSRLMSKLLNADERITIAKGVHIKT